MWQRTESRNFSDVVAKSSENRENNSKNNKKDGFSWTGMLTHIKVLNQSRSSAPRCAGLTLVNYTEEVKSNGSLVTN